MVKKIKNPLAKKKETSLITSSFKSVSHPKFAVLIQSHYRPKILKLMFDWYQEIALNLKDKLDLEIYLLQEQADIDLDALCASYKISPIVATTEMELGRKLNLALDVLKDKSIDALIYLKAGDLLSQGVFESYYDKLKHEDLLMVGLIDQYLYDATEDNFMYWSRDQHHQGLEKMGETGWVLSKDILNALDWKLWSNQSTHAPESSSKSLQKKLSEIFDRVKKGTCILSPLNQLGGFLISLKSELGRAIFDKVKWQNFKGLVRADFESTVDQTISTQWVDRISDFDERLILDILIEEQFGDQLWLQHYNDCVYKFLPYAKVRLRLISKTPLELSGNWSNWTYEAGQSPWQQAMALVSKANGDAVLVAGRGGLVDFKTIEYYIIRMVETNAKLMGLLNFYLINKQNQAYFWQGNRQVSFKQIFGFGLMISSSYLEALNWEIWDQNNRLNTQTTEKIDLLLSQNEAHKHVMYPCISHELTPIAILDDQGVFGFEGAFLMDELIPIQLYQRLPKGGFATTFEYKIKNWQNFINASAMLHPKTTKANSIAQDNPMTNQALSPLEKAKALLAKAKNQSVGSPTTVDTPIQTPAIVPTNTPQLTTSTAELSPLEKAKALLAKAKAQSSSPSVAVTPTVTPAVTPAVAPVVAPTSQALEDENLAQMQTQMQAQMQEALALLNQVQAKLNPINPQVQFLCEQGENAFMAQNLTVAQQFFESALLIDPNHVDSLNNLAVLSQAQGNAWKALSLFLMALQIQPNHEITTENLMALLEQSADLALPAKLILG